jgi:hypothetical protein
MFDMSNDSDLFHTREQLDAEGWTPTGNVFTKGDSRMLPLYEAKMLHHYDHRWATYDESGSTRDCTLSEKQDAEAVALPRYWVAEGRVRAALPAQTSWLTGFRNVCRNTDERSAIISALPVAAVGNSMPVITCPRSTDRTAPIHTAAASFVFDFVARQKAGGVNLNFFIFEQLPMPTPGMLAPHSAFILPRALELGYTAYDMEPFAADLGDRGAPFRWDESRRPVMRAELDALFFHLYGVSREDADYILDTFPIVRRKDEAKYGTYRTKELILAEYDRMAEAGVSLTSPLVDGENYTSTLTPPPGHGPRHPVNVTNRAQPSRPTEK